MKICMDVGSRYSSNESDKKKSPESPVDTCESNPSVLCNEILEKVLDRDRGVPVSSAIEKVSFRFYLKNIY